MEGIQFVTNHQGHKVAVLIDLLKYGDLWEDFYDRMLAEQRKDEPRESLDAVRNMLREQGKLYG